MTRAQGDPSAFLIGKLSGGREWIGEDCSLRGRASLPLEIEAHRLRAGATQAKLRTQFVRYRMLRREREPLRLERKRICTRGTHIRTLRFHRKISLAMGTNPFG
jgi:hypothetical protein